MKKKLSLTDLAACVQVLEKSEQKQLWGGLDPNDCFWKCMSYIFSFGSSYTANDAMLLAKEYYGNDFDESNYVMSGTRQDYRDCVNALAQVHGYTGAPAQILACDPQVFGISGAGQMLHAVVITGYNGDSISYFDPQNKRTGTINRNQLGSSAFITTVRPQTSGSAGNTSYNGVYVGSYSIDEFYDTLG